VPWREIIREIVQELDLGRLLVLSLLCLVMAVERLFHYVYLLFRRVFGRGR
jgi:hypothetical protein